MPPRRRLSPDQRRAELLDIGAQLFAEQPYDQVQMDRIAARAGVSRALLYRHFPTKSALFAAIYQRAAGALQADVRIDPDLPLTTQVAAALDIHLEYFETNRHTVLAANRALSGDPVVQAIVFGEHTAMREVVLAATGRTGTQRTALSAVLTSWLIFVHTLCLDWLEYGSLGRTEVHAVCMAAFNAATSALDDPDGSQPSAASNRRNSR